LESCPTPFSHPIEKLSRRLIENARDLSLWDSHLLLPQPIQNEGPEPIPNLHSLRRSKATAEDQEILRSIGQSEFGPTSWISKTFGARLLPLYSKQKEILKFLKRIFPILDRLLFFGLLKHVDLVPFPFEDKDKPAYAISRLTTYTDGSITQQIHINLEVMKTLPETGKVDSMIGTRVHEAINSFFEYFKEPMSSLRSPTVLGRTGHGMLFLDTALAVKKRLSLDLGRNVDLGLEKSLRMEMKYSDWSPSLADMRRWRDFVPKSMILEWGILEFRTVAGIRIE
jgi:hypothetical protein